MTRPVIARDKLGPLTKIAQGGQGVVYQAPNVKVAFADAMVYKEYKSQVPIKNPPSCPNQSSGKRPSRSPRAHEIEGQR